MAGKFETQKVAVKKRAPAKSPSKAKRVRRFLRRARKDWRYQIFFSIILLLGGIIVGCSLQKSWDKDNYGKVWELERSQLIETYEAELANQREQYELELDNLRDQYENPTQEERIAQEAEWLARVLYGTARNHSSNSQRTLCWAVINRTRSNQFPNTIEAVCKAPKQWVDFDAEAPILTNLYNIAYEELTKWHNGEEECDESFCYMLWSSREIQLKNTFETTNQTRYWTYD